MVTEIQSIFSFICMGVNKAALGKYSVWELGTYFITINFSISVLQVEPLSSINTSCFQT